MIRLSALAHLTPLLSYTFALFNHYFSLSPFTKILVKCQKATASDLPLYDIFALQKVPFLKITDDVIACDLWFGPPPQSKILATPMEVCLKTLCNAAMKPSLLKRHLERNHPNKMKADESYFQRLADNVKRQRMGKTGQTQQKSKDVVAASCEIALLVAEQKQRDTLAESLILPGAKILVKRVFEEQAIAKLKAVSFSDNTMKRRIEAMSDDIADQILAEIKKSKSGFAIQLDKSTDTTNYCQLLVYVRYAQTNVMKTELLLNHEVSTTTKGKNFFDVLKSFF